MKIRIEPKKIDRLANNVETVSFQDAEFFGLYVERVDEEFGETYWEWVWDSPTMDAAYLRALSLGDSAPTVRAA